MLSLTYYGAGYVMFKAIPIILKGRVIHDFTYKLPRRKCPHMGLVNITPSGQCIHLCSYCYARGYRWSAHPEKTNEVGYYINIAEKLEEELSKMTLCPPLYLSATTDVFQPINEIIQSTLETIKTIMRFGVSFHVVTRSKLVRKMLEIPGFASYPYFFLEMSVETIDDEKRKTLSPNSTTIRERIETLRLFASKRFYTVMRIDPVIFGYSDKRDEILQLLQVASENGVKHIITSTTRFDAQGMQAVKDRLIREGKEKAYQRIKESYIHEEGWLRVPKKKREEFHINLRTEAEKLGMTYAVCTELDRSYDSWSIPHCEGSPNSHMMVRDSEGRFRPVCYADCFRGCPNQEKPPCGTPQLAVEYPYNIRTLFRRVRSSAQIRLSLG
jgi:DNA repair photolyase